MNVPTLAFLFVWFSSHQNGLLYAERAFRNQNKIIDGYIKSQMKGIHEFGKLAFRCLENNKEKRLSEKLLAYSKLKFRNTYDDKINYVFY